MTTETAQFREAMNKGRDFGTSMVGLVARYVDEAATTSEERLAFFSGLIGTFSGMAAAEIGSAAAATMLEHLKMATLAAGKARGE